MARQDILGGPETSISEWIEEKECGYHVPIYPLVGDGGWDCAFIGEVECFIMPGTGQSVEWVCPDPIDGGCGAHHFEERDDE